MIGADLKSPPLAEQVAQNIAGQREADRMLSLIQGGIAHPDALYVGLMKVWGDMGGTGLLGALRVIQKRIERAA